MRVLVDTNIIISALLFPDSVPAKALIKAEAEHDLILCEQNIIELRDVLRRKRPELLPAADELLLNLVYELIPAVNAEGGKMRDAGDQPILNAAIMFNIDIIVTGDKDFLCLELDRPKIMRALEFINL